MDQINQIVAHTDKYAVVLAVLFIILFGVMAMLWNLTRKIK